MLARDVSTSLGRSGLQNYVKLSVTMFPQCHVYEMTIHARVTTQTEIPLLKQQLSEFRSKVIILNFLCNFVIKNVRHWHDFSIDDDDCIMSLMIICTL